jgi:hypothetical protein
LFKPLDASIQLCDLLAQLVDDPCHGGSFLTNDDADRRQDRLLVKPHARFGLHGRLEVGVFIIRR